MTIVGRDIDLAVLVSSKNLDDLKAALTELKAERIFFPEISEEVLLRGHACHFRCGRDDVKNLRVDIIGVMRGVDSFPELWNRRKEVELPEIGKVSLIGLADLVRSKKTQRDKDWPMIRRLIEVDIFNNPDNPSEEKKDFWFSECRTVELLILLAEKYPESTSRCLPKRPLLQYAAQGNQKELQSKLREEEDMEREADRRYWKPLRKELEAWRLEKQK